MSAALVLGGVDVTGPHLHTVSYIWFVFICVPVYQVWHHAGDLLLNNSFTDLPPWINWHAAICYNGLWFPRCNGCFWIEIPWRDGCKFAYQVVKYSESWTTWLIYFYYIYWWARLYSSYSFFFPIFVCFAVLKALVYKQINFIKRSVLK